MVPRTYARGYHPVPYFVPPDIPSIPKPSMLSSSAHRTYHTISSNIIHAQSTRNTLGTTLTILECAGFMLIETTHILIPIIYEKVYSLFPTVNPGLTLGRFYPSAPPIDPVIHTHSATTSESSLVPSIEAYLPSAIPRYSPPMYTTVSPTELPSSNSVIPTRYHPKRFPTTDPAYSPSIPT